MFGIGFFEIVTIGIIILIFVGPEDLPRFARNIGRLINEFRQGKDQFMEQIREASAYEEIKQAEKKLQNFKSSLESTSLENSTHFHSSSSFQNLSSEASSDYNSHDNDKKKES